MYNNQTSKFSDYPFTIEADPLLEDTAFPTHTHGLTEVGMPEFIMDPLSFGGEGNEVPVRTLIPKDKSRCRYLHVQFVHVNAREKWRLVGVSLEPREVSSRGYR